MLSKLTAINHFADPECNSVIQKIKKRSFVIYRGMAWELNENHKHNQSSIFFFNHFLTLIFLGCIMEIALRIWKILLLLMVRAKLFHKPVASYSCMSVQSNGEIGKPFRENIDRRSCYDGNWELISVFYYPNYPK